MDLITDPAVIKRQIALLERREVQILKRRKQLREDFGLVFYKPHEKQDPFHRAGDFYNRLFEAGNRSGKSTAGVAEDCSWLLGYRPFYPEGDPARYAGIPPAPNRIIVVTENWQKSNEVFTNEALDNPGKLWTFLPKGFVKRTKKNHLGEIYRIECVNGSILQFAVVTAFQKSEMSVESTDWDAIHVDEPCPEGMFNGLARGLMDRDGRAWFTLTPKAEPWIGERFFPNAMSIKDRPIQDQIIDPKTGRRRYWAIRGSSYDNPHVSNESIDEYSETLDPEERMCRIFGIPTALAGIVYKEFEYERHVMTELPLHWENWNDPPRDYCIRFAIDPHPQEPNAVLFMAQSPHGYCYLYDYIYEPVPVPELCELIKDRIRGRFVVQRLADPLAWIPDPNKRVPMVHEFAKHGVWGLQKAAKDLRMGILKVRAAFKRKDYLFVAPTMERWLWEIRRYRWSARKNKPVDEEDHLMECTYRLLLNDPKYIERSPDHEADIPWEDFTDSQLELDVG